jgi:hypothetical protein
VPVISIPLAFTGAAACTVHPRAASIRIIAAPAPLFLIGDAHSKPASTQWSI